MFVFHSLHRRVYSKGFSFPELLVVISIVAILSVVAYSAYSMFSSDAKNRRVTSDLIVIEQALENYRRDHQLLFPVPVPKGNQNVLCYKTDATYAHDCGSAAFIQGFIDSTLLTKRYLRDVPTDPRTGSRYAYGVTPDGKYYMVAGLGELRGDMVAYTATNVGLGFHLPSLIRAYDGPNFVIDSEKNLPYPPDATTLVATIDNVSGTVTLKNGPAINRMTLAQDEVITTAGDPFPGSADLYFSDGSITHIDPNSELVLANLLVQQNNKEGAFTKILLKLTKGKIWNKVARLAKESEFRIETTSAIAGVRGTEFGMAFDPVNPIDPINNFVIVASGIVDVAKTAEELNADPCKSDPPAAGCTAVPVNAEKNIPKSLATSGTSLSFSDITDVTEGSAGMQYIKAHQKTPLHPGVVPFVTSVEPLSENSWNIYVSPGAGISSETYTIDGFEVWGAAQFEKIRALKAGEAPLLNKTIAEAPYVPEHYAWRLTLSAADSDKLKIPAHSTSEFLGPAPGEIQTLSFRAYRCTSASPGCESKNYSALSWPLIGLPTPGFGKWIPPTDMTPAPTLIIHAPANVILVTDTVTSAFIPQVIETGFEPADLSPAPMLTLTSDSANICSLTDSQDPTAPKILTALAPGECILRASAILTDGREITGEKIITITGPGGTEIPAGSCGDGIIQNPNGAGFNEECDGTNLNGKTCADKVANTVGGLTCNSNCTFNTTQCTLSPEYQCTQDGGQWIGGVCQKFLVTAPVKTYYAVNTAVPLTLQNVSPTAVTLSPATATVSTNDFTATAPGTYTLTVPNFDPVTLKVCKYVDSNGKCWSLASTNTQSCDDVCSAIGSCDPATLPWTVDTAICDGLVTGATVNGTADEYFSPLKISSSCKNNSGAVKPTTCGEKGVTPYFRICQCK